MRSSEYEPNQHSQLLETLSLPATDLLTMSLPTRKIGNTDVTAIGFGAMGLGTISSYGPTTSMEERLAVSNDTTLQYNY